MPSRNRRKKRYDVIDDVSAMATSGRYIRKVQEQHPSARLGDYPTSTVIRNVTTQRKSEQTKGSRSHSVPSLNSMDVSGRQLSPVRAPRSNSVRGTKKKSIKEKLAKMLGSHSDLTGRAVAVVSDEQTSSGTYKPIGGFRPRSLGGSSDCSTSSLTSAQQQSELSRNDSLRDSSRSKISQVSVFSGSRQTSYDSAENINYAVHGGSSIVPSESGLRPRSIACMQTSGSSSSLRVNAVHSVADPRYHSIAVFPPRVDNSEPLLDRRGHSRLLRDEPEYEESERVKPSDPEYRRIAKDLMTCSPQPPEPLPPLQRNHDPHSERMKKISGETIMNDESGSPRIMPYTTHPFENNQRSSTQDLEKLPTGWEAATTPAGLKYYINHNSQSTHWKLPNDPDEASTDIPVPPPMYKLCLPEGWELVKSKQYGTYYVNHNNCTALYQHPVFSRPPPSYHSSVQCEEEDSLRDRKPIRSQSHRGSNRVLDPTASLPRRSKSFRDRDTDPTIEATHEDPEVLHTRQLSTMTYVPPSPFQIAEIPQWLKNYVDAPFGSEKDTQILWSMYSSEDLSGLDTMIKRLLKKNSEQFVKKFEYYRVALQQEMDGRNRAHTRAQEPSVLEEPAAPFPPSTYLNPSPSTQSFPLSLHSNNNNHHHFLPHLPNGFSTPMPPPSYSNPHHSQHSEGIYSSSSISTCSVLTPSYQQQYQQQQQQQQQQSSSFNINTEHNVEHKDVYDGLEETFV